MQFDYDHIVKDLKFKVTRGTDKVFERQYGLPWKTIELEGNNYTLDFDQIEREVGLYKDTDFVKKVETLEELHYWVDIIRLNVDKTKSSLIERIIKGDAVLIHKMNEIL